MTRLQRIVIATLIASVFYGIAFFGLSMDARIGAYKIKQDFPPQAAESSLVDLYTQRNTLPLSSDGKKVDDPESLNFQKQTSHITLTTMPVEEMRYYAPGIKTPKLLILNSVTLPRPTYWPHNLYAPALGDKQLSTDIPRNYLLPGVNTFLTVVPSSLGWEQQNREYLGPLRDIDAAAQYHSQLQIWLPSIVLAICLCMIFVSFLGLLFSQRRVIYLTSMLITALLALICIGSGQSSLSVLISTTQSLRLIFPSLILILLIIVWICLKKLKPAVSLFALALMVFALSGPLSNLILLLTQTHFLESIFVSNLFLVSALPLLIYITVTRTSQDISTYGSTLSKLRQKVGQQEAELDEKSRIIAEEMQRRGILEERQRMMRDIHDGIGGQLLSLLLRVRTGRLNEKDIADDIQASLNDLRLVVDSIDHVDEDFDSALVTFRSRAEQQMKAANIRLSWEQSGKLFERDFSPRQTLQIYRFMQEALTNIIRHANTKTASISILSESPTSPLIIKIKDDGVGLSKNPAKTAGKGLRNLEARAKKLGGSYTIHSNENTSGTLVTLSIPHQDTTS